MAAASPSQSKQHLLKFKPAACKTRRPSLRNNSAAPNIINEPVGRRFGAERISGRRGGGAAKAKVDNSNNDLWNKFVFAFICTPGRAGAAAHSSCGGVVGGGDGVVHVRQRTTRPRPLKWPNKTNLSTTATCTQLGLARRPLSGAAAAHSAQSLSAARERSDSLERRPNPNRRLQIRRQDCMLNSELS